MSKYGEFSDLLLSIGRALTKDKTDEGRDEALGRFFDNPLITTAMVRDRDMFVFEKLEDEGRQAVQANHDPYFAQLAETFLSAGIYVRCVDDLGATWTATGPHRMFTLSKD